jgi:outer membrane protein TolC
LKIHSLLVAIWCTTLLSSLATTVDLATTLRLAGAKPVDLDLARNQVREAEARYSETKMRFFPWFTVGASYTRLDGNFQDAPGAIIDTSRQAYQGRLGLVAELRLGDAIYQSLAAKQRAAAAGHALETTRQNLVAEAASAYFDLLRAQAALQVNEQSKQLATDYESQITGAVAAGVVPEADQYRAQAQALRNVLTTRRALEDIELASARLCEILRLPDGLDLRGQVAELIPLDYASPDVTIGQQVRLALEKRPELRSREALRAAAATDRQATIKGPLIPDLTFQGQAGRLGGGIIDADQNIGPANELLVGLGWRIGPGGLFDQTRIESATARQTTEDILLEKARLRICREVIEAIARIRSISSQLTTTRKLLEASEKAYQLCRDRSASGISGVSDALRAEEDLNFARLAWFDLITAYNKAQIALRRATGG